MRAVPRSGRVVVATVLVLGVGLGALGVWFMAGARPVPGAFVDVLALPDGSAVVIRREQKSDHAFVEVRDADRVRWRGLVPRYAGTPGARAFAASTDVVTVRVVRGGHPHVFAFDARTGRKITSFDLTTGEPPDPAAYTLPKLATVGQGDRAVEILARPGGGARLILVELSGRRLAWKTDVPEVPDDVWIDGDEVIARTGPSLRAWKIADGTPTTPNSAGLPPPLPARLFLHDLGYGIDGELRYSMPAGAAPPRAYHVAAERIWIVEPEQLTVLDFGFTPVRTISATP